MLPDDENSIYDWFMLDLFSFMTDAWGSIFFSLRWPTKSANNYIKEAKKKLQ